MLPAKGMATTSLGTPSQLTSPNVRLRTARCYPQARDADIGRTSPSTCPGLLPYTYRAPLVDQPQAHAGRRDTAGELAGATSAGTERSCTRELSRP